MRHRYDTIVMLGVVTLVVSPVVLPVALAMVLLVEPMAFIQT